MTGTSGGAVTTLMIMHLLVAAAIVTYLSVPPLPEDLGKSIHEFTFHNPQLGTHER
jgi:hypothetical protein